MKKYNKNDLLIDPEEIKPKKQKLNASLTPHLRRVIAEGDRDFKTGNFTVTTVDEFLKMTKKLGE